MFDPETEYIVAIETYGIVAQARLEILVADGGSPLPVRWYKSGACWVLERSRGAERITVQPEPGGCADRGWTVVSKAICALDPEDWGAALAALEVRMGLRREGQPLHMYLWAHRQKWRPDAGGHPVHEHHDHDGGS